MEESLVTESAPDTTTDFSLTFPDITSPSQLQEVTLDQDYTISNSLGIRSPNGPMRGRSVKEFEEQLTNLKKENFNLKLRIYFLEERMGVNFTLDKENIVKKNIELLVEVESLRKEVAEKHELLCQAVKAMELEDEENKKLMSEKDNIIFGFQQEIDNLKYQISDMKSESIKSPKSYRSDTTEYLSQAFNMSENDNLVKELQEKIMSLNEDLNQKTENQAAVQILLDQNDVKMKSLTQHLEEANKKLVQRDSELYDINFTLEEAKGKWQGLQKKLDEKMQCVNELYSECTELKKMQNVLTTDLDKERKRYEKLKTHSEQKIIDLQTKLEASLAELKKSQELVVSKSSSRSPRYTDPGSFSVQKPTTPFGSPEKDPFLFPTTTSPIITPVSSPLPPVETLHGDPKQIVQQLQNTCYEKHQKITKLRVEQMKACKIIKTMIASKNKNEDEIKLLKQKNMELEKELEGVVSKGISGQNKVSKRNKGKENSMEEEQSDELVENYKTLTDELDKKNGILLATLEEKDNQIKSLQEQFEELLENSKAKDEHIVDLEFDLLSYNENSPKHESLIKQLRTKDDEIEKLNSELLKKNCDLQGLVNNELWEKNREIEKLLKKPAVLEGKAQKVEKLQKELESKDQQLGLLKEKIYELGIDLDIKDGAVNIENNLHKELVKSEKLRCEANDLCAILSGRLEELAIFLDSLLKQKSVLGFLGDKENHRLRKIIDESLNLSRSFSMSIVINPDQSLLHLTDISTFLNETSSKFDANESNDKSHLSAIPGVSSITYNKSLLQSGNDDNSTIIQTLRQQIINLKYELQLRDVELNAFNVCENFTEPSSEKEDPQAKSILNTTSTTLKYKSDHQSESEGWSEPDRSVSRARIGLIENSLKSISTKKTLASFSTDSTEDEEFSQSDKLISKKGHFNDHKSTILELQNEICQLDKKLNEREIAFNEAFTNNTKLKQEISNLEIKLQDMEMNLQEAENVKENAYKKIVDLECQNEEFTTQNKQLENEMQKIELEKLEALDTAKVAEETACLAKNKIKIVEIKLRELQLQMRQMEDGHEEKIQELEASAHKKIEIIQNQAAIEIKELKNSIQQLHEEYVKNYVKKTEVEEVRTDLKSLHYNIEALEDSIEEITEEKNELKMTLIEYEERNNVLRSDLDNATLQYSEAVLEKTKIANEKALLEQELNRSILKVVDTKKRLDQVDNELNSMKQGYQKQISTLQNQKSKLEVRISELESANADLHNRLIKIQVGCGDMLSSSLPNSSNFVNQIVSFQRQHSESAGDLSDGILIDDARGKHLNKHVTNQIFEIERHEANSSPDLGIESDHGRFSSLETNLNLQRPLLHTLELTASMNNLLIDTERNELKSPDGGNIHCCKKTLEMAHENGDLKRKLLRTRKALEEAVTQLSIANQRKKQVEKTICKQIHKTSQVLRKAKANLDSGSETDMCKK